MNRAITIRPVRRVGAANDARAAIQDFHNRTPCMKRTCLALLLIAPALAAQGTLTLSLQANHPDTFNAGPGGIGAALTNIVRTEPLDVALVEMPAPPGSPPGQLVPRRVQLWLGVASATPIVFPEGQVFIALGATPAPAVLLDSFTFPWHPTFGPPLQGPSNTIAFTIGADLFPPNYPLPLPQLALQAIAEDTPGNPLLVSNPVRFQLVDPQAAGRAPTITGISPATGPEAGGTTVTISGSNFLAQSNWIVFPPTVRFGTQAATNVVVVDGNTIVVTAPPTAFPTNPPATAACVQPVTVTNNPAISPTAAPATSPVPFLYVSPQAPAITSFDMASGHPEGGQVRTLQGTWLLDGLEIIFQSVTNPAAQAIVTAPPAVIAPGGTSVSFTTPPFCSGPVSVRIRNCDGRTSGNLTYTVVELRPAITSALPTFALDPALGGGTFPRVIDSGSMLTINGADFLTPASPLATAPGVPPGSFFPTRAFIDGVVQAGLVAQSGMVIGGTTNSGDETGIARPGLGFKTLRVENPPCVANGNAAPISNTPCPPLTAPCTILRQDASPPSIAVATPSIASTNGCRDVRISGANFFSLQGGVLTQDFTPFGAGGVITTVPASALIVPAVLVGTRFATRVTIESETSLRIDVPAAAMAGNTTVPVTIFNPDGQKTSSTINFTYVPALTDLTKLTAPGVPVLDAAALRAIAQGTAVPGGPGPNDAPAIVFIENPSPTRDRIRDPRGGATELGNATWQYAFLFNTRLAGASPQGARAFDFDRVDVPATLTLTNGGMARRMAIDPTIPAGLPPSAVAAGTEVRVIFKALGYALDASGRVVFDQADNHPFFLQSHGDMAIDGYLHLGGDAFLLEGLANPSSSIVGGPFRVRVERTLPPAGAGRGGRGGAYFPEGLTQLPGPNFGVTPVVLTGGTGSPPPDRFPLPGGLAVRTEGNGGIGTAPIGVQSGGGGGAGYAAAGANGGSGSSPGGFGGASFGNLTNIPSMPAGAPSNDALIYGSTPPDYDRFRLGSALATGMLYGGSGGGGGGGGLAIFVPAETLGGRGGNGGGALILLADCILTIGPNAALVADGEIGQLGVDVFPVFNGNPSIPVNLPGAGGGGSGGTILAFAVTAVCLPFVPAAPNGICPAVAVGAAASPQPVISARAGPGGPPPGVLSVGSVAGGSGSPGRLRFAVNSQSPYVGELSAALTSLFAPVPGSPSITRVLPAPAAIPAGYYAYPSM